MQTGEAEEGEVIVSEQETEAEDLPQGEEEAEGSEAGEVAEGEDAGGEEGETVVSIGAEEPPTSEESEGDSTVLADLRRRYRETSRELQKLKAQGNGQPSAPQVPKLRDKPTLEAHDFDAEEFQSDLDKWYAEKGEADRKAAAIQKAAQEAAEAQQRAVREVQEGYAKAKATLKVSDFQEAEEEVVAGTTDWQQGILAKGPSNPALIVYALGKNPKKLQELASIKDPVKFAVAVGKLETEVKVTKRTSTKPAPESTVRGGSSGAGSKATLERLQAEADKTGDRTKIAAYLRQQRNAGK
jgi:type II secretory pathway pseudopilin PulG